jgi:hypothetical protein
MNVADPVVAYRAELRRAASHRIAARRRRLLIVLVGAVLGVATASLSFAATKAGWLTGEPAPPPVVSGFKQYTPQLGFHPEAGKAQFVAQDGPIKLYATANKEGGICYLVDEPWKPADAGDGGTCASREKASVPISAGWMGGARDVSVIAGRVADDRARSVSFSTPDGDAIVRPLGAGGFYVAQVEAAGSKLGGHCPATDWQPVFVARGADGERLVASRILLVRTDFGPGGRVLSCGGEVTPHGPYGR